MPMPPDDSLHALIDPWWTTDGSVTLIRGRLIWAVLAHVDQEPKRLVLEGRAEDTSHDRATYRTEPLNIRAPRAVQRLPVAGMPEAPGELHLAVRAKRRPALVLAEPAPEVEPRFRVGAARWQTSRTILVAPYYGAEQGNARGGWKPEFVTRIRRAEYPQYVWDRLPVGESSTSSSILRLDHVQPISSLHGTYEPTPHRLSPQALDIVEEALEWLRIGKLPDGQLHAARTIIAEEFPL